MTESESESEYTGPRTLIVSWHWPPTNRASAGVLGALFASAPRGAFRVITRSFPRFSIEDRREIGTDFDRRIPVTPVAWPYDDQSQPTRRSFPSVVRTLWAMVRHARRIHRVWRVDRVLAIYPHRLSLLAGGLAAWLIGVPLVLYMHDLCAEGMLFRNPVRRLFWRWVDRMTLHRAWMIVVPTEEFAVHYRRRGLTRCWVLPHCVSAVEVERKTERARSGLRLVYSGGIYEPHVDAAEAFLSATDDVQDVAVTLLTDPKACGGRFARRGARWLPHGEAMEILAGADVFVVLLGRRTPCPEEVAGCFPSKIVDYLRFGRPILAVVPGGSFVDRLISESGCGLVVRDHDTRSIADAIEKLRDDGLRAQMGSACVRLAGQLRSAEWMSRLVARLEHGVSPQSAWQADSDKLGATEDAGLVLERSSCPL